MIHFKEWLNIQETTSISGHAGTQGAGEASIDRGLHRGLGNLKPVVEPKERSYLSKKIDKIFGKKNGISQNRK